MNSLYGVGSFESPLRPTLAQLACLDHVHECVKRRPPPQKRVSPQTQAPRPSRGSASAEEEVVANAEVVASVEVLVAAVNSKEEPAYLLVVHSRTRAPMHACVYIYIYIYIRIYI